ncbi:MAG: hypothetical protein NTV73_09535, partial [Hyphomicrobiales bacterium]|nr:hypothetical protein [Hyphomicrobiales bacterium]
MEHGLKLEFAVRANEDHILWLRGHIPDVAHYSRQWVSGPTSFQGRAMTTGNDTTRTGPNRRVVLAAGAVGTGVLMAPPSVVLAQTGSEPAIEATAAAPPASAADAAKAVAGVGPAIIRISREVWENAE